MELRYSIPTTKKDITTAKYVEISKHIEQCKADEVEVDNNFILSICLGLPLSVVDKLPLADYQTAITSINEALSVNSDIVLTFEFKGVKYGLINELENMTTGEYSALETMLQDVNKNACDIIGVLYRPIVKEKVYKSIFRRGANRKYKICDYNSSKDNSHFKDLPCIYLEGGLGFFYSLGSELVNATLRYTNQEVEKLTKEAKGSDKSGDGIKLTTLMQQLKEYEPMKFSTSQLIRYCID